MRLYALLLYLLPPPFRRAYGDELRQVARTALRRGDIGGVRLVVDLLQVIPREWLHARRNSIPRPRGSVMHDVIRDARHALRLLVKQPGFTLAAVLTLALGIGANTAMFTLADATLLRPVKVAEPERLAAWTWTSAYPDYLHYRNLTDTFDGVFAWAGGGRANVTVSGVNELASVLFVTGNAFDVLGVRPALGRLFLQTDDQRNGPIVGVLSHDYWRSRFGSDPSVVGDLVQVNGHAVTIVGVVPRQFRGMALGTPPAIYMPVTAAGQVRGGFLNDPRVYDTRNFVWLNVVARLREGVSREHASAVVAATYSRFQGSRRAADGEPTALVPFTTRALGGGTPEVIQRFVLLLIVVVTLTLLIGCANLANLLLAKTASRRQELGIRLAVGAGRSHIIRQLLIESAVLAAVGGLAGLAAASMTLRVLTAYQLPGGVDIGLLDLSLDRTSLLAAAALALITGLLFGAGPAWHASRTDLMVTLRETSRSASVPTRLRGALVATQVAVSLVLLAGSGLFLHSLVRALDIPTGFRPAGVLTASINPGLVRYDATRIRTFQAEALERVRALPGVTAVGWTNIVPINGAMISVVDVEGYTPASGEAPTFHVSQVTPEYFAAAGTEVLRGRAFTDRDDEGAPLVAIVSRVAADRYWPGEDPLGKQIKPGGADRWRTVVGVVENVTVARLDEEREPYVFYPLAQSMGGLRGPGDPAHLFVRITGEPRDFAGPLTAALRALDPQMPLYDVMPFAEHVRELIMPQQMGATLLGFFSALALSLACVGIYGVASYVAQLRTRELGIRMALGASAADVRRIVLKQGLAPAAVGIGVGVVLAMWAAPFARAFLYDVSTMDPITFTVAPLLLLSIALAATWLPARRAARVDPVTALREQ